MHIYIYYDTQNAVFRKLVCVVWFFASAEEQDLVVVWGFLAELPSPTLCLPLVLALLRQRERFSSPSSGAALLQQMLPCARGAKTGHSRSQRCSATLPYPSTKRDT